MRILPIILISAAALILAPNIPFADNEKKGHGAGGVRADHASDKGLEKGKAWAGSKEKKKTKDKKEKKDKKRKD
jgi:hypothetical protein